MGQAGSKLQIVIMANISFAPETVANILKYGSGIKGPSEGFERAPLANQDAAKSFEAKPAQEVTLLSFACSGLPVARVSMGGPNKDVPQVKPNNFQLTGIAEVKVGAYQFKTKMHAHTAAAFADGDKAVLIGTTGQITSGKNVGNLWLSLRPQSDITTEQLTAFAQAHIAEVSAKI